MDVIASAVAVAEEPSNGFNVICHGNGLVANGMSKHVASASVDAKLDLHKTPPPSKRLLCLMSYFVTLRTQQTQPFYGCPDYVWDNLGKPVPEETFTHSHLSWS